MKRSIINIGLILLLLVGTAGIALSPVLFAEEPETDDSWEDFGVEGNPWEGFEAIEDDMITTEDIDSEAMAAEEPSIWYLGGFFKEEIDYSYAKAAANFSKIRSTINLNLDLDLIGSWKSKVVFNGFYDGHGDDFVV